MNTERDNWKDITPKDATDDELRLVHTIGGHKPSYCSDEQWRSNMQEVAKHIRKHVESKIGSFQKTIGGSSYKSEVMGNQFMRCAIHSTDGKWCQNPPRYGCSVGGSLHEVLFCEKCYTDVIHGAYGDLAVVHVRDLESKPVRIDYTEFNSMLSCYEAFLEYYPWKRSEFPTYSIWISSDKDDARTFRQGWAARSGKS